MGSQRNKSNGWASIVIIAVVFVFLGGGIASFINHLEIRAVFKNHSLILSELKAFKYSCGRFPTTEETLEIMTQNNSCYISNELDSNFKFTNGLDKPFIYKSDGISFYFQSEGNFRRLVTTDDYVSSLNFYWN